MGDMRAVWRERFSAQAGNGLSVASYCRRHNLSYAQWMYWKRRLAASIEPSRVLPLQVASRDPGVEIKMTVGAACIGLHVADYAELARLVHALQC